jgi:hypothetical protein
MTRTRKAVGIAVVTTAAAVAFWLSGCGAGHHPPTVDGQARRVAYFWRAEQFRGNVLTVSLLDSGVVEPFIGTEAGNANCTGCHSASPTGEYVAASVGYGNLKIMDVATRLWVEPTGFTGGSFLAWNPNGMDEFVYSDGHRLLRGTVSGGVSGPIPGTNNEDHFRIMPAWSPSNVIAYIRGAAGSSWRTTGANDVYTIPVGGAGNDGTPLPGASADGKSHGYPAYSPNGQWLALSVSASPLDTFAATGAQIQLVRADGSGTVKTLPNLNGPTPNVSNSWPTWSLAGDALAFSTKRSGTSTDLYVAPVSEATGDDGTAQPVPDVNDPTRDEFKLEWTPLRD